jgi:hypothetical protein
VDVDVPQEQRQEASVVEQPVEATRTLVDVLESNAYQNDYSSANQRQLSESLQCRVCWKVVIQMEHAYVVVVEKMSSEERNQ